MNMRGKRKIGRKILAFVLSVCMLFTVQPNLWDGVMVQAAGTVKNDIDDIMQTFLDRIAALSDAEEYLASEPDMEDEDAYAEWEEKLYEYAEEALVIWEEYEALTEEQHAQIPEEVLEKLTAWMEIEETLTESSQVMVADGASHTHCFCGGNINAGDHTGCTNEFVYDNILTSDASGKLLINGIVQSDYTLTSGSYYLGGDVTLNSELIIEDNSTVYICLNDKKLENSATTGCVIYVGTGSKLTLCDCQNKGNGCITGGKGHEETATSYHRGGAIYLESRATFSMFGGFIEKNEAYNGGGAIYTHGSTDNFCTVNIYGGKIINNSAGIGQGGGILGTFSHIKIWGGSIEENTAGTQGGGILADGDITISDASIINNKVNSTAGGGIFSTSKGEFYISGTVNITGNTDKNGEANNICFRSGLYFNVTDNLEGSSIGVTAQSPPTSTKPTPVQVAGGKEYGITPADWRCFFSDKDGYEILRKETTDGSEEKNPLNELYLALPGSCDLSELTISTEGVKLEPDFQENKTTYTATVGNDVESIDITATLKNTPAEGEEKPLTMKIDDESAKKINSGEEQTVNLKEGKNTIAITVTSGGMSKTYTIEITREVPEVPADYNVTLNGKGGTGTDLKSYTYGTGAKLPTDWTKTGHDFAGWYEDESCEGTAVTEISATTTGDKEYYAKWTPKSYTVTLNGNEGSGGTDLTSYTYGTGATMPLDWTRAGYDFVGWYDNQSFTGAPVKEISANDTGNKAFWAKWTATSYTISYNLDGGTATGNPTSYTVENNAITLVNPTKEGNTFTGWSGTGLTGEQNTTVTISKGSTGHRTYTAHWKLANYTVTLHPNGGTGGTDLTAYTYGTVTTLPTNWTKKGYVFDGWYDKENLTGTAVTNISGTDTGNKEYWAKWMDNIAPVIGTLSYDYQPKNLWQWLIGKDSLVITVPVTEEGSGADKITYTETPDGGTASTKTANITEGKAEITVSADFKGTISIACTDKANNTSASVTVGAGVAPNGIIIEDNAPQIAFQAENAELLPSGEYKTVPDIAVAVVDNKNNAISGGIASVNYKIGNGSEKTVAHDYTTSMVVNDSFTIPASEIPAGETKITVTATDNAGNSVTQNYTVKVHTHSGTLIPAVEPTCTTAGNKEYYTCTCGKWFSDSGCTDEITDHTEVVKKALGHDFTGKYQFDTEEHWMKCSRCSATDSREAHSFVEGSNHCTKCEFEKAGEGHTHKGELHEKVEPTCTTKGNTAYYTCNCGKWFSDSSCTVEITDKSKIEIAALEHDFVMKHDQNEHWQQCSRCSLEQSRGLHEYDDDSDTDCNVCGYVRTIQHTHSGTLVPAVEPTCTEDGHEAYYTCSCGEWFSDSGCVNKITDHASVTVEKRGHDFSGGYQSDENGHWKVCSRCNVAQAAENHEYDDDNDTDCNQCGYRRNTGNQGNVSKDVEKDEKAPDTVLSDSAEELADTILTEEEKGQIGNGTDIKFILNVKDAGDTVSGGDKTAVQQTLDGNTAVKGFSVGQYLDISLFKVIGDTRSAISQTARKLTIVINVPDSLKSKDSAKPRTYAIIRVHDGVAEVLADLDGDADTITIATDRFSAYALVYKEAGSGADVTPTPTPGGGDQPTPTPGGGDKPTPTPGGSDEPSPTPGGSDEPTPTPGGSDKPSPTPGGKDNVTPAPSPSEKPEKASGKEKRKIEIHSGLKAIQTGKKLQISWGRVTGADGYSVYVQYCGKDFSAKSLNQVKSGKKTKITVKKVNGKKLDTTKNFKLYVVAWKWKNGKKSTLAKTLTIHVAGKDSVKYTNVKSIRLKKTSYTLKKGGTVTLHPKAVLYDKHKKQLSAAHCKEFRYLSSNKKVATVTAGGKVKAKGTGECTIYVFAKNGCRRKIKIKVKK